MTARSRNGPLRLLKGGIGIACHVTPSASVDAILGLIDRGDGEIRLALKVRAAPDKGAANRAVIALIARSTGIPKSALAVHAGATGRTKTIRADAHCADAVKSWMDEMS